MLGAWWSYEVLGWGGFWAWDPVENASFHPWLTGTAFLHSAMVLQRRGRMRDWTLILGMSTFLLTLLEPALILAMAVLVLFIVLAILMPIISLHQLVR